MPDCSESVPRQLGKSVLPLQRGLTLGGKLHKLSISVAPHQIVGRIKPILYSGNAYDDMKLRHV